MASRGGVGEPASPPASGWTLARKMAALRDPATYPGSVRAIEAIETHFAWVFLTGSRAYKLKKPLSFRGADLRTLAAREHNCHEELRVNARLSPEVYLRVAPLAATDGRLAVDGPGDVEDWLVVMRELPAEQMLSRRLAAGRVGPEDVGRLVDRLVAFYRRLPAEHPGDGDYVNGVEARLGEALGELARPEFGLPSEAIAATSRELEAACTRNRQALAARAQAGRIVEAHGDLRAEHVWLGSTVEIIDALEFDRALRVLDTAEEIAMLFVDLERLGSRAVASWLRDAYRQAMPDPVSDKLFAFYAALRAITRAKVSIWHLDDAGQYPDAAPWQRRALSFVEIARRHAAAAAS